MDAPYNKGLSDKAILNIVPLLNHEALCLIETHKDEVINLPPNFSIIEERKYGIAKIVIVRFLE